MRRGDVGDGAPGGWWGVIGAPDDPALAAMWREMQSLLASGPPQSSGPTRVSAMRPGRNDPCPCGSGAKYKRCCDCVACSAAPRVPPWGCRGGDQRETSLPRCGGRGRAVAGVAVLAGRPPGAFGKFARDRR